MNIKSGIFTSDLVSVKIPLLVFTNEIKFNLTLKNQIFVHDLLIC